MFRVVGFSNQFLRMSGAILLVALVVTGASARADDRASARDVVEHFQNGLLYTLLHRHELDYQTRIATLEALIGETFDVERVARKVIGADMFAGMPPAEQRRYLALFTRYAVASRSRHLGSLEGKEFIPTGRRHGPDGTVVIDVSVREDAREIATVAYLLIPTGLGWRIVDVVIDGGVSELTLRRSEFASVVKARGVDGLMQALGDKIGELARAGARRTY